MPININEITDILYLNNEYQTLFISEMLENFTELDKTTNEKGTSILSELPTFNNTGIRDFSSNISSVAVNAHSKLYNRASDKNDPEDQFQVGLNFFEGFGTSANKAVAERFFSLAAEQGHTEAQYRLGLIYENGFYLREHQITYSPNLEKAVFYYTLAAENNYPPALCNLAEFYIEGRGVKIDKEKAYEYLKRAADQKNPVAENYLSKLFPERVCNIFHIK